MATAAPVSPSRQRVLDTLAHRTPDRIPIDFGSSTVCGIHTLAIAELRDYYGLEKRPVKIFEPFQMLGLIDDDLKRAMGIDVEGVYRRKTMFGFANDRWKEWRFHGRDVLVSEDFVTSTDANGDLLIHPEGDRNAPPSGRMPQGFYFFDAIIRQNHFDEENLNPEDNMEEFKVLSDADLAGIVEDVRAANETGRAVVANLGGMGYGDIALVPAPFLKDPRGIRDITEWYVSLRARKEYVHKIFERQTEVALQNLERGFGALGNSFDALFVCGTDFGTQTSSFCSVATFRELWLPYYKTVCDWVHKNTTWKCFKHSCGSVERFYDSFIEAGFDIVKPGAVFGGGDGAGSAEGALWEPAGVLGRGRGYAAGAAVWDAGRGAKAGAGALRDIRAGWWLRVQHDPQHPGPNTGCQHRGDVGCAEGI
ncbi:MAG: methyltransferase [Bryobacterales bacterium]|nr:methyltransferase [Bryobacterales bacterium]